MQYTKRRTQVWSYTCIHIVIPSAGEHSIEAVDIRRVESTVVAKNINAILSHATKGKHSTLHPFLLITLLLIILSESVGQFVSTFGA